MANGVWLLGFKKKEIVFKKYPFKKFKKSTAKKLRKNEKKESN